MGDVKTQVDRGSHLVDVLAAGTLGANLGNVDFPVGQFDGAGECDQCSHGILKTLCMPLQCTL